MIIRKGRGKKFFVPAQYRLLSEFCRETSQAILLTSVAGYFLPPAIGLETAVSFDMFLRLAIAGLTLLITGVILVAKGEK
jgi:hypothetical protein